MFFIACKLVSITTGFLYPAYSSYKAIRNNDAQAIEHWLMYAVVLSVVHAAESTVEWTVNWIPFYYELKSIVIIWLTLPQIQGSTFVYLTYVDPFLTSHEAEIDKTIASSKEKARAAGLDYMRRAWEAFRETVIRAIMSPDDAQAGAALAAGASRTTNTTANANANAIAESSAPVQPQPQLSAASQGAYAFAGNVLRTYGPAAMAILKPLSPPRAGVGAGAGTRSGPASRGKKDDDLFNESAAGRYPADLGNRRAQPGLLSQQDTEAQRRVASASAALVGAVTSTAHATANKYAGLSRQQLRQRRLELERELAALDSPGLDARNASLATSASASASASPGPAARRTPSPIPESLRPGPPSPFSFFGHSAGTSGSGVGQTGNSRDRHTSAPTPARSAGPSPGAGSSLYPPLDASTTFAFDAIARDEINDSEFPPDWGRNARSQGWRGAPPAPSEQQQSRGTRLSDSADRPPLQQQHQQKRGSWFGWGGSSQPATQPVPSGAAKKNA